MAAKQIWIRNYERFCDLNLYRYNNITTGKIYSKVIEERKRDYLERPFRNSTHHRFSSRLIEAISMADGSGEAPEACVIELGGTVGDIESSHSSKH